MDSVRADPWRVLPGDQALERNPQIGVRSAHDSVPELAVPLPGSPFDELNDN